jgi:hypothetical protein
MQLLGAATVYLGRSVLDTGEFSGDHSEQPPSIAMGRRDRLQAARRGSEEPQMLRRFVRARNGSGQPAATPLMRALAAALWLGTCLAPAALAADSSNQKCPDESPLGGWVRMQHVEHTLGWPVNGCEQVINVFLTFDLVNSGPSVEWLTAHLPPQLPPQVRQQQLNAILMWQSFPGGKATKIKYRMWSDWCHDVGGKDWTCNAPGGTASGEVLLGERTPTGFRDFELHDWRGDVGSVAFNPLNPSLDIPAGCASGGNFLPSGTRCPSVLDPQNSPMDVDFTQNGYCGLACLWRIPTHAAAGV